MSDLLKVAVPALLTWLVTQEQGELALQEALSTMGTTIERQSAHIRNGCITP